MGSRLVKKRKGKEGGGRGMWEGFARGIARGVEGIRAFSDC